MSRKTIEWKRRAVQANFRVDDILPRRAEGKGVYLADTMEEATARRVTGKICCRHMTLENETRIIAMLKSYERSRSSKSPQRIGTRIFSNA